MNTLHSLFTLFIGASKAHAIHLPVTGRSAKAHFVHLPVTGSSPKAYYIHLPVTGEYWLIIVSNGE